MSNEIYYKKKYLSYKLKYLQAKLMQNGGGKAVLNLPKDIKKLKKIRNNQLSISSESGKFIIKDINTKQECDTDDKMVQFLNQQLNNKNAKIFIETDDYPSVFLHIDGIKDIPNKYTTNTEENITINYTDLLQNKCFDNMRIEIDQEFVNQEQSIDSTTNKQPINNTTNERPIDTIKERPIDTIKERPIDTIKEDKKNIHEQISMLKEEIEKLKTEFDNHYHDLPTTGVRQYTK